MKIKLLPGIEYEDIDPYRVYEVISERVWSYIVLDDESDENAILKGDCEIVDYGLEEKPVREIQVGDRVVFDNDYFSWYGEQFTVTQIGYGDAVGVLSDTGTQHHFSKGNLKLLAEDPANKQVSTIDLIKTFTLNHKNLEISFEDDKIIMRDWGVNLSEPVDYRCDTIEQLEELMGAWEKLCKFKGEAEG